MCICKLYFDSRTGGQAKSSDTCLYKSNTLIYLESAIINVVPKAGLALAQTPIHAQASFVTPWSPATDLESTTQSSQLHLSISLPRFEGIINHQYQCSKSKRQKGKQAKEQRYHP